MEVLENYKGTVVTLLSSLTSLPIAYSVNLIPNIDQYPFFIFVIAVLCLLIAFFIPYFYADQEKKKHLYHAWGIFTFAAVIDLIIALENDGIVHSFMAFYFVNGEPYLKSGHGTAINYHDGIIHFAMYLLILTAIDKKQDYRSVGLYWAGSIINSLIVLMIGGATSHHGARWSMLLNVPYMLGPVWVAYKLLNLPSTMKKGTSHVPAINKRPVDLMIVVYFAVVIIVYTFKGLTVLGCDSSLSKSLVKNYEPYLQDPISFPKIQILTYLFYYVPFSACAIHTFITSPQKTWFFDMLLMHGGAAFDAQFTYMFAQLHHLTPKEYQLPATIQAKVVFWVTNLFLMIVPQLILYYYYVTYVKVSETDVASRYFRDSYNASDRSPNDSETDVTPKSLRDSDYASNKTPKSTINNASNKTPKATRSPSTQNRTPGNETPYYLRERPKKTSLRD